MSLLNRVGLMTIAAHNAMMKDVVDKLNLHVATELEKRTMQVDETILALTKWKFDRAELLGESKEVNVAFEVPRSLLMGIARAEADIAGFALARVTHMLQVNMQRVINQIAGHGGPDPLSGSYL